MDDPVVFFNDEEIAQKKVKTLAQNSECALKWESVSCSEYSPAIVANDELIARLIFSPIHFETDTKELTPLALDDVFNKGLSTNRLKFIKEEALHQIGENKAESDRTRQISMSKEPDRLYLGYVVAKVFDIRSILEDKSRLFSVYDTSLEKQIDHADVCCLKEGNSQELPKKSAKMFRRSQLKDVFSKLITYKIT